MSKPSKPRKQVRTEPKPQQKPKFTPSSDYESFLIAKIDKCQKVVSGLRDNEVWRLIKEDYEVNSKSLDLAWAFEDPTSPKFRQMQVAKMASATFINLEANYEHDLKLAKSELEKFQKPDEITKKDYDEEGIKVTSVSLSTVQSPNAYHEE